MNKKELDKLTVMLQDADYLSIGDTSYEVTSFDPEQMQVGAEDNCIFTEEHEYGEEHYFTFDCMVEAAEAGELYVYVLTEFDSIPARLTDLINACGRFDEGSTQLSLDQALEDWCELDKDDDKALLEATKLRVLGHAQDAQDIIERVSRLERQRSKRAEIATKLMFALSAHKPLIFYVTTEGSRRGRYGVLEDEYVSFV